MTRRNPAPLASLPPKEASEFFTRALMQWHAHDNFRQMPWKGEKSPYRIWLSEIILQQTRVEQGWAYYEKFISAYPDVSALASASDAEVFKMWEGLGYYARCRNLLKAARKVVADFGGIFPRDHAALLSLHGVGPYTAAAVASFAFGLPHAVVDGNVLRVLARYFGVDESVDELPVRRKMDQWAQSLLHVPDPGAYNQAIMDFGATVCKPANPLCDLCPLAINCAAFRDSRQDNLPVRTQKSPRKERWMYYLVVISSGHIALSERTGKDVWRHLYQPILLETEAPLTPEELIARPLVQKMSRGCEISQDQISPIYTQLLTHQQISGRFVNIRLQELPELPLPYEWFPLSGLHSVAFPRHVRNYFDALPEISDS
jgi:A/G-specific adenine glycosylase